VESDAAALQGESARWVPPSQFCRLTRKFWLHPSGVTAFKVAALKHLPILIFGDRQKLSEGGCWSVTAQPPPPPAHPIEEHCEYTWPLPAPAGPRCWDAEMRAGAGAGASAACQCCHPPPSLSRSHTPTPTHSHILPLVCAGNPTSLRFLSDQAGVSDSSDITSVYYDDPEAGLPSYHARLRREDAATLVRVRW
jgi:SPX domain protein involved in polyphosphate accumulation